MKRVCILLFGLGLFGCVSPAAAPDAPATRTALAADVSRALTADAQAAPFQRPGTLSPAPTVLGTTTPAPVTNPASTIASPSKTATPLAASPPLLSRCPQGCTTPPTGCAIKGNINADREKIYHVPGGASYAATIITTSQGERWFCTEDEAKASGWRKSAR